MTAYAAATQTAAAIIKAKGGPVVVTLRTSGEYDPDTSSATVTETAYNGHGVLFEYGTLGSGRQRDRDSNVLAGDKELLLSALQADGSAMPRPDPDTTRVLAPDGVTYAVRGVKALEPSGVPVFYELHLSTG